MPNINQLMLIWLPERDGYELRRQGSAEGVLLAENDAFLHEWLADHTSLSFQGRYGSFSMLKEARQRGSEGYWYAHKRKGKRVAKQYLGRSAALTIERLEAAARAFSVEMPRSTAPAGPRTPLLAPKLRPPRLRAALVSREHLLARLDAAPEGKLTLLSAPAGFGKTTLVGQWIARRSRLRHPPAAWVALDAGDNDPVRFWDYMIAACQAFRASVGRGALSLLHAAHSPSLEQPRLEAALTLFLNDLSRLPGGVLVLEDYHVITSPQIHQAMAFFLQYLPASFHLMILTRSDPPLPLARLRASGDLHELRAADLRFTPQETLAFLRQTLPFPLDPAAISHLDVQMDGWVTGLRLVTLMLQGASTQPERDQRLAAFSGTHRPLLDYFVSEVLEAQPAPLQQFLLQTSMLSRLTGSLCDAVTGRDDSQRLLEAAEHANLFVQPLAGAGQWYRYHPLFAESLAHEAQRRLGADMLRACCTRASVWYEQQDMLTEAVEAALAAQAFPRAAALIEQLLGPQPFYEWNEYHTLRRWLSALPDEVMASHPWLCLRFALVLLACDFRTPGYLDEMERPLLLAEHAFQAEQNLSGLGETLAIRAVKTRLQGDLPQAADLSKQALAWLSEDQPQWRGTCQSFIAAEHLLAGDFQTARQMLLASQALFQAAGNHYAIRVGLLSLGELAWHDGELRQAAACYQEVLRAAGKDRDDRAKALLGLARLSYEWNVLESAEQQAREALELGVALDDEALQAQCALVLANVYLARGDPRRGLGLLDELLTQRPPGNPLLRRAVLAGQARLQLAAGDLEAALRWADTSADQRESVPRLQRKQEVLAAARLLIVQDKPTEALRLLEDRPGEEGPLRRTRSEIERQALIALARADRDELFLAMQALRVALLFAQPEGYQRLFLDEGRPMEGLLRLALAETRGEPLHPYVRSLVRAIDGQTAASADAAGGLQLLSFQERRVLALLAAGCTKTEIARKLVVSVNTVKTQVRSIYGKLGASSRSEVIAAARRLHLI